jgi:hypothetical protein
MARRWFRRWGKLHLRRKEAAMDREFLEMVAESQREYEREVVQRSAAPPMRVPDAELSEFDREWLEELEVRW